MTSTAIPEREPLTPEAFALLLALNDLTRAIRAEPGVSMRTCSGRLHSAVGSAEHLSAKYLPEYGRQGADQ